MDKLRDEARILVNLPHDHIVTIYDYEEEEQGNEILAYIVTRFYEAESLHKWFKKRQKPLQVAEVASILEQAGDAVQYIHSRGLIHRDIKPQNFLVQSGQNSSALPTLLLTDFGIAQYIEGDVTQDSRGTPHYKAPEQWDKRQPPMPANDQYALAIMAYYLLTCRYPFTGDSDQLEWSHKNTIPDAPSTCSDCSHIPPTVDAVILRALKKSPRERYPSVQAFTKAFRDACDSSRQGKDTDTLEELVSVVEQRGNPESPESVPVGKQSGSTKSSESVPVGKQSGSTKPPESVPVGKQSGDTEPLELEKQGAKGPSLLQRGLNAMKPDRRRGWRGPLIAVIIFLFILIIAIAFLLPLLFLLSPTVIKPDMLCDRNCVIDKNTLNSEMKSNASSLQSQGDKNACEYWYWASQEDPADGEARIAYQNYPFQLNSQNPCSTPINLSSYINLVTVVHGNEGLDNSSHAILQGVALRQQEFNDAHPNGPLLHVLLAKITDSSDQEALAQQILGATKVKGQYSVAGVIVPPTGAEALIGALSSSNIPMLSIAPNDDTTPTPFLLSVAPSFKDQADATINFIKDKAAHSSTRLKVVPFSKSGDTYGRTIVNTFWQEVQGQGIDSLPPHVYTKLDDLVQAVQSIDGLSMLYLAASTDEASKLQAILRQKGISLQVLGPADMYQWVYQNYTSEEMGDLVSLQFTAFAYHDTSTIHDHTSPECIVSGSTHSDPQYDMLKDYSRDFSSGGVYFGSAYTRKLPSSDTILAYDAVSLMERAGMKAGNSLSTQALWSALQNFTPNDPFPGFSGQISFQAGKSTPYKKAVLLITVNKQGNTVMPIAGTSATVWEGCYQFVSK